MNRMKNHHVPAAGSKKKQPPPHRRAIRPAMDCHHRILLVVATILIFVLDIHQIRALSTAPIMSASTTTTSNSNGGNRIVILGGSGRIGTAVAIHLLERDSDCHVVLVGRRQDRLQAAVLEVLQPPETTTTTTSSITTTDKHGRISTAQIDTIWKRSSNLEELINHADCLIHTAGPYSDQTPVPLQLAIQSPKCRAYVDVSDPLPYLEQSLLRSDDAKASNLTAMVAAGAFPGMSNVLAVEAASPAVRAERSIQDVRFQYFTAGLGGSGAVNLYITNLGFGEPMVQYDRGVLRFFMALSGRLLGKVDFFLSPRSKFPSETARTGNRQAKQRIGSQTVFTWPFPEAATVPTNLPAVRGNSYAAMGTAPDLWNTMLGLLVNIVPRPWWKNAQFSKLMADFSQPLVRATDKWLEQTGVGETHAMRVDVTYAPTSLTLPNETDEASSVAGVSIVQGHDSFRTCVGQSCAEFALDILQHSHRPGVYLPEQFYRDREARARILERLTTTPGTFCYTGPVGMAMAPDPPSLWQQAIQQANDQEQSGR